MADVRFRDLDPVTSVTIDQLFAMGKEAGTDSNKATAPQVWRWVAETLTQGVITPLTNANLGKYNIPSAVVGAHELQVTLGDTLPIGADLLAIQTQNPATHPFSISSVAGVTINGVDTASIALVSQGDGVRLQKVATNEYVLQYLSSTEHGLPDTPQRVLITDASGNVTTSDFLKYTEGLEELEVNSFIASELFVSGNAALAIRQNVVSSIRDLVKTDVGVYLSKNPGFPSQINLPPVGDTSITTNASFYMLEKINGESLTVQAPAGVELDGVDGGSISTSGFGNLIQIIRNNNDPAKWISVVLSEVGSVPTYQEVYDASPNAQTNLVNGKPFVLSSTEEGFRVPEMTEAQFSSISGAIDGLKAWTTDESREVHNRLGGTDKVAYISDIEAITEDVIYGEMYFQGNATETVIAVQSTPVKVSGTYNSGDLQGFSQASGTLTYTETDSRTMAVRATVTGSFDLANGTITVLIAKNGTVIAKSGQSPDLDGTSPSFKAVTSQAMVNLLQNDTIEVFVQNDTGTENITIKDVSVIAHSVGGSEAGLNTDLQEAYDNGNGIITMTDNKPIHYLAATSGQKRGQVITKMTAAEFAAIPGPIVSEMIVTSDEVLGATRPQIKTFVGGFPTTSSVAYLSDIPAIPDVQSGVPSLPVATSSGFSTVTIQSSFYHKIGNIVKVQFRAILINSSNVASFELTVPFTPAFTSSFNASGTSNVQLQSTSAPNDGSKVAGIFANTINDDQVIFNFYMAATTGYYVDCSFSYEIQ
jgi:hypothetical protein